jgi:hypothetical protein
MSSQKLFKKAKIFSPSGVTCDNFIPIVIDGQNLELRYFTERGSGFDVEFNFYLATQNFARKSFIIWQNGRIEDNDDGDIPKSDMIDNEPIFSMSNEELVLLTLQAIETHNKAITHD